MMKKDKRLTHLLIPKQFRVWCRPNDVPGDFHLTTKPFEANCANCLTAYRRKIPGFTSDDKHAFRVHWINNRPA